MQKRVAFLERKSRYTGLYTRHLLTRYLFWRIRFKISENRDFSIVEILSYRWDTFRWYRCGFFKIFISRYFIGCSKSDAKEYGWKVQKRLVSKRFISHHGVRLTAPHAWRLRPFGTLRSRSFVDPTSLWSGRFETLAKVFPWFDSITRPF